MKIGVIREGKTPPDERVPLNPQQCEKLLAQYPNLEIVVQPSQIRCYKDEEYKDLGIPMQKNLNDCDVILGVKEVPLNYLIPNKKFLFFSHTIKEQPYNKKLIKALMANKIQMIDYEVLTETNGQRLIGFGRFAGIVGAYNGILALGQKTGLFSLKPAHKCDNKLELEKELEKVRFPKGYKIVLTGRGRVALGSLEIIDLLPIKKLSADDYLSYDGDEAVYTHIDTKDYAKRIDGSDFDDKVFRKNPELFENNFLRFAHSSDMFVAGHFYGNDAPYFFTREDAKNADFRISLVADISCDIDGPVASTIKPSTIEDPIYGYNRMTEKEDDIENENVITVMAVDNLPCELPKDASDHFGNVLSQKIIPALLGNDETRVINRASITTLDGELGENFSYLHDYAYN